MNVFFWGEEYKKKKRRRAECFSEEREREEFHLLRICV
jgi:hypothetical protein